DLMKKELRASLTTCRTRRVDDYYNVMFIITDLLDKAVESVEESKRFDCTNLLSPAFNALDRAGNSTSTEKVVFYKFARTFALFMDVLNGFDTSLLGVAMPETNPNWPLTAPRFAFAPEDESVRYTKKPEPRLPERRPKERMVPPSERIPCKRPRLCPQLVVPSRITKPPVLKPMVPEQTLKSEATEESAEMGERLEESVPGVLNGVVPKEEPLDEGEIDAAIEKMDEEKRIKKEMEE
ncbi:hypothetical protein PFISCL1PPCAC_27821, partial [Pristionchus fissidentatus]